MKTFNGIGGINNAFNVFSIFEIGGKLMPVILEAVK